MYFINVETTLIKGNGKAFELRYLGPFGDSIGRGMFVDEFWQLLDELNEELGLPSRSTDAIGANLVLFYDGHPSDVTMLPWKAKHAIREIKRHYEKFPSAIAA